MFAGIDQCVGAFDSNVDWFFYKYVEAMLGGSDSLLRVKTRWTTNHDHVHRFVIEKGVQIGVGRGLKLTTKRLNFTAIVAKESCDVDAVEFLRRTCVSFTDSATTDNANVRH